MRQSMYTSVEYAGHEVKALNFGSCFAYEHTHGIEGIERVFSVTPITHKGEYHKPRKKIICLADDCIANPNAVATSPEYIWSRVQKNCTGKLGRLNNNKVNEYCEMPIILFRQTQDCTILCGGELGSYCYDCGSVSSFVQHFAKYGYNSCADKLAERQVDFSLRAFWDGDSPDFVIGAKSPSGREALKQMYVNFLNNEVAFGLDPKCYGLSIKKVD